MSFVALRECSANLRTSSATTANPRPASPARAASIAAFNASKLVCSVMSLITLMISEISRERSPSDLIFFAVACTEARMRCMPSSVSRTARLPCSAASSARRAASALASALLDTCFIETVSSSTALDVLVISWSCCVAPACISSAASKMLLEQTATRHLVDHRQQVRDAPLQRIVRFLVARSLRNLRHRAIQILRDVAELVVGADIRPRLAVTRGQPFRERGQLTDGRQNCRAKPPCQHDAHANRDDDGNNRSAAFKRRSAVRRLLSGAVRKPDRPGQGDRVQEDQHPNCATQSRFHSCLPNTFL